MDFEYFWDAIEQKDARMIKPETEIRIKSGELKKMLRQFYRAGYNANAGENIFNDLFRRDKFNG